MEDKHFLNFAIPRSLLVEVDDFRFEHRFISRTATVNWLLEWALKQNPKP